MLTLSHLHKSFLGSVEPVLKNLNFTLNRGDFCVVIGSNGSGKSTLFRTLTGEYEQDKGEIQIAGKNIPAHYRSQHIAYVSQDVNQGTIPEMTLLENMVLGAQRTKQAKFKFYSGYQACAKAQIKSFGLGLEDKLHVPLKTLSGGQRQMVATLMAIHSNPEVLLLDEHTAALDPQMQIKLMNYTAEHVMENTITAMMITHKLSDAIQYGNRLMMLSSGRIVLDVKGAEKAALTVQRLLSLFHKYEDLSLLAGA